MMVIMKMENQKFVLTLLLRCFSISTIWNASQHRYNLTVNKIRKWAFLWCWLNGDTDIWNAVMLTRQQWTSGGISCSSNKLTDLSGWVFKCLTKFYMVVSKSFTLMLHILQVAIILFGLRSLNFFKPKGRLTTCRTVKTVQYAARNTV